jgi:hypothetical protein
MAPFPGCRAVANVITRQSMLHPRASMPKSKVTAIFAAALIG